MPDHIVIGDIRPRIQYAADGIQTAFTYPFPIFAPEDLQVYVGAALQGAEAIPFPARAIGRRHGQLRRSTGFRCDGDAAARAHHRAHLRFPGGRRLPRQDHQRRARPPTAFVQEAVERIERAIVAAPTETAAPLVLPPPAERANALLGFDAEGAPIAAAGPAGAVPVSTAMAPVVQAATLTAARQLLGILGNERLAKTGAATVANADKGKTIACGAGPWTLTFEAPSGYDADFAVLVLNESGSRGIGTSPSGATAFWLFPGQTAFVYASANACAHPAPSAGSSRPARPSSWMPPMATTPMTGSRAAAAVPCRRSRLRSTCSPITSTAAASSP